MFDELVQRLREWRALWPRSIAGGVQTCHRLQDCLLVLASISLIAANFAQEATEQESQAITTQTTVEYRFGQVMRFFLSAEGESEIEQISLFIQAPEMTGTMTFELEFEPALTVDVEQDVDLTQTQLAPFTTVTYWWRVQDTSGNTVTTPEQTQEYADDQFVWRESERNGATVRWTGDDDTVGQVAMDVTEDALRKLATIMPTGLTEPLDVFVYPSASDLRAALRLTGRDWVGAHAHPELGVILVSASNPRTAAVELGQSIPHELSHLLLYQATGVAYESTPRWFDEGLATIFEAQPNPNYDTLVEEAVRSGTTIPFGDLCRTFPGNSASNLLSYAESASLIRFIQSEYGNQALTQMILALADGADCESVTTRILDKTLAELGQDWLRYELPQSTFGRFLNRSLLWLMLLGGGFALVVFLAKLPRTSHEQSRA